MWDRILWMMLFALSVALIGIVALALMPAASPDGVTTPVADCTPDGAFDQILTGDPSERVTLPDDAAATDDSLMWGLMSPEVVVDVADWWHARRIAACEHAMPTWVDSPPPDDDEPCPDDAIGDEPVRRSS